MSEARRSPYRQAIPPGESFAIGDPSFGVVVQLRRALPGRGFAPPVCAPFALLTEMMFMSTSRRGLTLLLTGFGSLTGFVGLGWEVLVHALDVAL